MVRSFLLSIVIALALPSAPALAQADEEAAVRGVVDRLFDAMRAGDSAGVRAVFHPRARLVTAGERDGEPMLQVADSIGGFVTAVGSPHPETWDERIWDVEVRVDGRLAAVWAPYAFYLGETLSHCGVDAFQLFKDSEGWQIIEIADTRRREGCEPPAVGEPAVGEPPVGEPAPE